MRPSADALRAGDTLSNWPHYFAPLDCRETYETLIEGLAGAKAARMAALAARDDAKMAVIMQEIIDLTYLTAELADGLALQRSRWIAQHHPWPLGTLT